MNMKAIAWAGGSRDMNDERPEKGRRRVGLGVAVAAALGFAASPALAENITFAVIGAA